MTGLFESALGADAWRALPPAVRTFHDVDEAARFAGEASVERGDCLFAGLIAWAFGFPAASEATPVLLQVRVETGRERWRRRFGRQELSSTLITGDRPGRLVERFGPISVAMDLSVADSRLALTPARAWLGPIPLPRLLTPLGTSYESADAEGRFRFDIGIRLPWIGRIVRYRGWLRPAAEA